jgi:acyl-CoA thioesterase-2
VSYQVVEEGLNHEAAMPDVAAPETLQSDHDFWQQMHEQYPDRFGPPFAQGVERRVVERRDYINPKPAKPQYNAWFRVPGDLGEDLTRHQTLLAYISDFALLGAALLPHPYTSYDREVQVASLDHAIWFHRPGRVDDYLLYSMDSPNAGGGRGFSRGQFFSRDGRLIASTAQESLIRVRKTSD